MQTDTAKQPKIVDGGNLLEDGIDFNGTSHFFDIDFGSNLSQPNSFFLSHTSDTTNSALNEYFDTASGSPRTLLDVGAGYRLLAGIDFDSGFAMETNRVLISAFANSTSSFLFKNGVSSVVGDAGTDSINQYSYLGRSFDRYYDGKMDEFIIYNSDQSTKRRAIEENIANHYDISLAAFSRDGTVSTWYDQSGNTNDATQTDPTKQPKIVDGGSLLTNGVTFDQANETVLKVTGDPVITADYTGTYSAFSIQTVSNSEFGYLYGNASIVGGSSLYNNGNVYQATNKNVASGFDKISKTSSKDLLSAVYNNGDAGLLVDGGGTMVDQGTYNFDSGTADFRIGNRAGGSSTGTYLTG